MNHHKIHVCLAAVFVVFVAGRPGTGGEPPYGPPPQAGCPQHWNLTADAQLDCEMGWCRPLAGLLQRMRPTGGWHPDRGGLLHWWNPRCFPCSGGPDDYCKKSLPCVCWPPYPPYYISGSPAIRAPQDCSRSH